MSHKPTPISLITICLATSRLTKRATSLLLAVVLLASIYTTALNLSTNSKVYAAPTPDSCFAINASTPNPGQVTITNYYDHQNNDNLQPACTRDPEIPTTLGGESVTHIGGGAFCEKNLTSVVLPSSLQVIADRTACGGAFAKNNLTSVVLPPSVTSVGSSAFSQNLLTTVSLNSSLVQIGGDAFRSNNITSLTLPASVNSIGDTAFVSNAITSINIQGTTFSAGYSVFGMNPVSLVTYNGNNYTSSDPIIDQCYIFNSGTGTIEGFNHIDIAVLQTYNNACIGMVANIPSIIGGTSVAAIGPYAMALRALTSVTIANGITAISDNAFFGCGIQSIVIPNSVTTIGAFALAGNRLAEVTIPNSVTTLDPTTFFIQTTTEGVAYHDFVRSIESYHQDSQVAPDLVDNIIYTRIYIDPSQASTLGLADSVRREVDEGGDINQDGDTTDVISAQLINPAAGLISYSDGNGNELQPDDTVVGDGLYSYLAIENPTNDFNLYYRLGSTQTFTPPVISGYPTPPAQTVTLTQGQTAVGFVYGATTNSPNANGNTPSSGNLAGLIPGVPNTGFQLLLNNPLATLTLTSLAAITILYISRRWARR
ncbi:leucine-rich repeat domain-containing protein [Candidatus Saccharibacteria bacterium]|nr:MAG: leucine-rich repeat domain-containing protein [Candidatus Saccharibacteria bacterium]